MSSLLFHSTPRASACLASRPNLGSSLSPPPSSLHESDNLSSSLQTTSTHSSSIVLLSKVSFLTANPTSVHSILSLHLFPPVPQLSISSFDSHELFPRAVKSEVPSLSFSPQRPLALQRSPRKKPSTVYETRFASVLSSRGFPTIPNSASESRASEETVSSPATSIQCDGLDEQREEVRRLRGVAEARRALEQLIFESTDATIVIDTPRFCVTEKKVSSMVKSATGLVPLAEPLSPFHPCFPSSPLSPSPKPTPPTPPHPSNSYFLSSSPLPPLSPLMRLTSPSGTSPLADCPLLKDSQRPPSPLRRIPHRSELQEAEFVGVLRRFASTDDESWTRCVNTSAPLPPFPPSTPPSPRL